MRHMRQPVRNGALACGRSRTPADGSSESNSIHVPRGNRIDANASIKG
jgi:hypothetical protein